MLLERHGAGFGCAQEHTVKGSFIWRFGTR